MKKIIIITKSIGIQGPSRGAICIANAISDYCEVTLISLSNDKSCAEDLNNNVQTIIYDKFINRIKLFFDINFGKLSSSNGYDKIISLTFSADIFSIFLVRSKQKIISIRGDLFQNYEDTYGKIGRYIAWTHYLIACQANTIVCLSYTMEKQIKDIFPKVKLKVIENFIDEVKYDYKYNHKKKNKINRFVFVGQLTNRKKIFELIKIFKKIIFEGETVFLDIIGDGPVKKKILNYINVNKLEKNIYLFGAIKNPEFHLSKCDVFILPFLLRRNITGNIRVIIF